MPQVLRAVMLGVALGAAGVGVFLLGRRLSPPDRSPSLTPDTTVELGVSVLRDSLLEARNRILRAIEQRDTYLPVMLAESDSMLRRWRDRVVNPLRVFLPEPAIRGYSIAMAHAVRNAFARWERVGDIPVTFTYVPDSAGAEVRVRWIESFEGPRAGQADLVWDRRGWFVRGTLTLATHTTDGYLIPPDGINAVAMHEIGHLLGLGHSDDPRDLMYPTTEIHDLTLRDRHTAQLLYALPPGSLRIPAVR